MQAQIHRRDLEADVVRPSRRWQEVIQLAQVDLAEALARRVGAGRFDRSCSRAWLALESVACRIGALSLDAVARWHGTQPDLQATAGDWARDLRDDAQAAMDDIHALDGSAGAPPSVLGEWHAFAVVAADSQRAGEVLGATLLHAGLIGGPMRVIAATLATLPCGGSHYLARRLQPDRTRDAAGRALLVDVYAAPSLSVGAQRAAVWYRAALAEVLEREDQ